MKATCISHQFYNKPTGTRDFPMQLKRRYFFALSLFFSSSFLFLDEMNTSSLLLGLSMCVNAIAASIFFVISRYIIKLLGGSINTMAFSCFCWAVRYLCLAMMTQPYHSLMICLLNGLTCSLFVAAYIEYINVCIKVKYKLTFILSQNGKYFGQTANISRSTLCWKEAKK